MRRRRSPEVIAGRVNADGTIAAGDGFTVVKGGAGGYTINFPTNFRVQAFSHAPSAANNIVRVDTWSGNSVGLTTVLTSTVTATDGAFSFVAVGVQQ